MSEEDIFNETYKARHLNAVIADSEKVGLEWTGAWNSGLKPYQESLTVFKQPFDVYLQERQKSGGNTNVLELMGQGQVLKELPVQNGLAVTLGDSRWPSQTKEDSKRKVEVIAGDVLDKKTWKAIGDWQNKKDISGFDLVLAKPEGGLSQEFIPHSEQLYYWLLNNIWKNLSKDQGIMVIQVPELEKITPQWQRYISETLPQWMQILQKLDIKAEFDGNSFMIIKNAQNPDNLPIITAND